MVEKSAAFGRRVGEATVEVSAYFLGRILGLTTYLNEAHLVKQGMRFWFCNKDSTSLEDCSEIGGRYMARVPAYQVDRSTLDEELLCRACQAGAELLRLGENAIYRLAQDAVVVRIARTMGYWDDACKEVDVARWLAANGIPTT